MSRILYGVAGQGFGHAMRSKVVLDHLKQNGHAVEVVTYGQAFPYLKKFFSCHEVSGLHLVYKQNKLDYLSTVIQDTKKFPEVVKSFNRISRLVDRFSPQLVISDYEPLSSLQAHLNDLPLISIGNHHFITNTEIKFPPKYYKEYLTVKMITKAMTPKADAYLVTTIAPEKITDPKTFLFPPLLQDDVLRQKPRVGESIVVYVTSEFTDIMDILSAVDAQFIVYGLNKNERTKNVTLKEFSREGFIDDLRSARAVIANAGFTAISEALYFGKPYLALPISGQFEQIINAVYIERLGLGEHHEKLTVKIVNNFLRQIEPYRRNIIPYKKAGNRPLLRKLDTLIERFM